MDLPRPEVTVTDPRRPGPLVAVEEPEPPRLGRRGAALLAAVALAGAAALFAADVVRDRRLDGVVDIALGPQGGGWASSHDARTGTGSVRGAVRLLNHGPRDVRVTSAQLGALRYEGGAVLDAGEDGARVVLQRTIRCPGDGPPPTSPQPRRLRVRLETPAGPREVSLKGAGLPLGLLDDSVQNACAYPPLGESVQMSSTVVRLEGRTAVLRVDVANDGRWPVHLLSLIPARGLQVLSIDGDPARLPMVLPAQTGREPIVRTLDVRLGVLCGALLGADLLSPFEELSAIVQADDYSQITSVEELSRDPTGQLRQLAGQTCSSF